MTKLKRSDFLALGQDQLIVNVNPLVFGFGYGNPPPKTKVNSGGSSWNYYNEGGDFMGLGYAQLLHMPHHAMPGAARIIIAEYRDGNEVVLYSEIDGDSPLLDGWQDANDSHFVGDFMGLGRDQVMFLNNTNAGDGRVMIVDFKTGGPPAAIRYLEMWGQSPLLDGWLDRDDLCRVGDFMGLGYDQVLFINKGNAGDGKILIVDFRSGGPPAVVRYLERWGQSRLLDGWLDDRDKLEVGDFLGQGKSSQLVFTNNQNQGDGHYLIVEFRNSTPPPTVLYWENWPPLPSPAVPPPTQSSTAKWRQSKEVANWSPGHLDIKRIYIDPNAPPLSVFINPNPNAMIELSGCATSAAIQKVGTSQALFYSAGYVFLSPGFYDMAVGSFAYLGDIPPPASVGVSYNVAVK